MQLLNISIRDLKALVDPVLPFVGDNNLPILAGVHLYSTGPYLIVEATDRYRVGIHRMKHRTDDWPEFSANIPKSSLTSLFALFKLRRGVDHDVTLSITDAGLQVTTAGEFDGLFSDVNITFPLIAGEWPNVRKVVADALAATPEAGDRCFNWQYMADFRRADKFGGLSMHFGPADKPIVITDGEDFIGALMPRRKHAADAQSSADIDFGDWATFLSPAPSKAAKKGKAA